MLTNTFGLASWGAAYVCGEGEGCISRRFDSVCLLQTLAYAHVSVNTIV